MDGRERGVEGKEKGGGALPDHVSATVRGGDSNFGLVTGVVTGDHSVAAGWSVAVTHSSPSYSR